MADSQNERPRVVLVNRCFICNDDGELLIIKRAQTDTHNAGKWEVPGGKLDEGQDFSHAQEREVMEETSLVVEPTHPFIFSHNEMMTSGKYKGLCYIALFSITRMVGGRLKLSDEHTDYKWVTYDDMRDYDLTDEVKKAAAHLRSYLRQQHSGASFCELEDLVIGDHYKLTEVVERMEISSGNYILVSVQKTGNKDDAFPVLGFSKTINRKPEVFLVEAHAQFGNPAWRRAFKTGKRWEVYWPVGGRTWVHSHVIVERISANR